jgi:hypothetical protein
MLAMTINNPSLYDAAFVAIANSNCAWLTDSTPIDYAEQKAAAAASATADPVIANYLKLVPEDSYTPSSQATATATGTPTTTTQFAIGGNPVSWISQTAFGVPFIQQGEWTNDFYASVNQPVSTTNLFVSFYARTTGGVETLLFSITGPRVTLSTPVESSGEATEATHAVNTTDRLVVKVFGQFTGTTVSTTATLYFQGLTNASHVHSPIQS